jgi:hypothetical protein
METSNSTVVEGLCRVHEALLRDLKKLDERVGPLTDESPKELLGRLEKTMADITEHFRYEEQNGYMETVRKREPRLERAIEHLAEEHRQLLRSLLALLDEARSNNNLDETLHGKVLAWTKSVRSHEARENELIEDAFNLDISAED